MKALNNIRGKTVGEWLAERLARSRYEAGGGAQ